MTIHPRALNLSSLIKEEIEQAHGRVLGKNVAKPTRDLIIHRILRERKWQGLRDLNLHKKYADEDNVKMFEPKLEGIKVLLGAHHKWSIEKTSKKN